MTLALSNTQISLKNSLTEALLKANMPASEIHLERPKNIEHGDFSTNIAMQLAKQLKTAPRQIAQAIIEALPDSEDIDQTTLAGAGFINFFLSHEAKIRVIKDIGNSHGFYGADCIPPDQRKKILIEFVSANPTGPLHVGRARGAAFGATLANLLEFAGHHISREYYVNDAGRQMDILAFSTWLRYISFLGHAIHFPDNAYLGDYVQEMAQKIHAKHGDTFLETAFLPLQALLSLPQSERLQKQADVFASLSMSIEQYPANWYENEETRLDILIHGVRSTLGEKNWLHFKKIILEDRLSDYRNDLDEFGVTFDQWFSEQSLFDSKSVERVTQRLEESGHLYEKDGAIWFRSTDFGDEKDRVIRRENGQYTYFASDIAYHDNKFSRGFKQLVNVWGADHHGYISRVKGALKALGHDSNALTVVLIQFVSLFENGKRLAMSTRKSEYVTLRQLRKEVGNDACRFFYLMRKAEQSLDFDMTLAKSESSDNPVFYIQYAYARLASVMDKNTIDLQQLAHIDINSLRSDHALALCAQLEQFPEVLSAACVDYTPHSVAFYLRQLAALFHSWYNAEKLLVDNENQRLARLALAKATQITLYNGMKILGITPLETM